MAEGEPETREQFDTKTAYARHAHDRADEGIIALASAASTFAVEALKAPALVNGGSAAAMLAFIGTARQPITADTILGLKLFGAGLLTAALATGASWISQICYLECANRAERRWHHPFIIMPRGLEWAGNAARVLSVLLVVVAYGLAGWGMWSVASSLVPMPGSQPTAPALPIPALPTLTIPLPIK